MTKIINWKTNETIIEDSNLSIKELVEKAVKEGVSLAYADLRGADLDYADLRKADLSYADLSYANLYGADLKGANLWSANLGGANLYGAEIEENQVKDLLKAMNIIISFDFIKL